MQYGYPQAPPPKPFPVWAILLIVGGVLFAALLVGVGVLAVRMSEPPTAAPVRTAVAPPVAIGVHVTVPPTTSAGKETQLWIGVHNDGRAAVGRCRIVLSLTGVDVSWSAAQKDINLLGLFDAARSFDFPEPIAAGDARIFKLAFVPASAGRLTVGVSASHNTESGDGAPCVDVREQKQTISVGF